MNSRTPTFMPPVLIVIIINFVIIIFLQQELVLGIKTGKVIGYATRSKRCATCQAATRTGRKAKYHDCRCNWDGSSKSMEADACAELIKSCENVNKAHVNILVGDEYSCRG